MPSATSSLPPSRAAGGRAERRDWTRPPTPTSLQAVADQLIPCPRSHAAGRRLALPLKSPRRSHRTTLWSPPTPPRHRIPFQNSTPLSPDRSSWRQHRGRRKDRRSSKPRPHGCFLGVLFDTGPLGQPPSCLGFPSRLAGASPVPTTSRMWPRQSLLFAFSSDPRWFRASPLMVVCQWPRGRTQRGVGQM
ncbi:hypothetical protein B0T18DRAFT_29035 [Schizothecium vesticola]|uniref:Uncharacterized protein n=1 Tax=Schizothecium vesticola TaxID=314040 RepID=A0AA40FAJ3_9PEZI|nr:hypothetical protein B0T18DRAFT_29035 [Schizothecium vesticola]